MCPKARLQLLLKQIQHTVQIDGFPDGKLILRLCQIVKKKFQNQSAAKPPPLDFKIGKAHGKVGLLDIIDSDKAGIFHRLRKAIAALGVRRGAAVLRPGLAQVFPADRLIALLSLLAAEKAAFVAEKFGFILQGLGQRGQ